MKRREREDLNILNYSQTERKGEPRRKKGTKDDAFETGEQVQYKPGHCLPQSDSFLHSIAKVAETPLDGLRWMLLLGCHLIAGRLQLLECLRDGGVGLRELFVD